MALPVLGGAIALLVGHVLGAVIFRVLLALGVGFATFTGVDFVLGELGDFIRGQYGSIPTAALQFLGLLRFDQAVNMILSAIAIRYTLGFAGSSFTKLEIRS